MGSTHGVRTMSEDFKVAVDQQHADVALITIAGEMDIETCPLVDQAAVVLPLTNRTLHLELSGVTFMDSAGLNLLLRLRRRVSAAGGHLKVSGLQDQPKSLLQITEALTLLCPDETPTGQPA